MSIQEAGGHAQMNTRHTQAIANLRAHIDAGTLTRNTWIGQDERGRETACLLAAMVPQCGTDETATVCPAEVMPLWLAKLTPWLDDNGSAEAWPGMVDRFANLAARWHSLDAAAWLRVEYGFRAACVREALTHVGESQTKVRSVCERVIALCEGVVDLGAVDDDAFVAAWAAATAAAVEAARASAASAAASAARASAASAAASAGAGAATCRSASAGAGAATCRSASEAEAAMAADRLTAALFDLIDAECGKAEAR